MNQTTDNNEMKETHGLRRRRPGRWIILGLAALFAAVYLLVPTVQTSLQEVFRLLSSMDVEAVAAYIRSFGAWAMAVSFLLMVLQSLAAPIPAFLLTFANAAIFGWWQGAILSWTSAMAGAALCFAIARLLGRDAVVRLTSGGALQQVDVFFERYGRNAILIMRLLPFVSFDLVSYAAGLTSMGFAAFFIATGIGQLPATLVYSYVGGMLTGGTKLVVTGLLILFALSALVMLLKKMMNNRNQTIDAGAEPQAAERK